MCMCMVRCLCKCLCIYVQTVLIFKMGFKLSLFLISMFLDFLSNYFLINKLLVSLVGFWFKFPSFFECFAYLESLNIFQQNYFRIVLALYLFFEIFVVWTAGPYRSNECFHPCFVAQFLPPLAHPLVLSSQAWLWLKDYQATAVWLR